MPSVVILGAGKIGTSIAQMLSRVDGYAVTLTDSDAERLNYTSAENVEKAQIDAHHRQALEMVLEGKDLVISALPFFLSVPVSQTAAELGVHYFDLTEDVETTRKIKSLAARAETVLMPQCGLAPGFVGIVARDLTRSFDKLEAVRMRVGALPQFPTNALKYNLTWSTDGLINEYCNPCEAIVEGMRREVLPWKAMRNLRWTAPVTRRSTPRAALAPFAKPWKIRSSHWTTKPSVIQGIAICSRCWSTILGLRKNGIYCEKSSSPPSP